MQKTESKGQWGAILPIVAGNGYKHDWTGQNVCIAPGERFTRSAVAWTCNLGRP